MSCPEGQYYCHDRGKCMPIATDNPRPEEEVYDWYDTAPSEYEPPMQESDWFIEKPDESDEIEEEKTMHQKM